MTWRSEASAPKTGEHILVTSLGNHSFGYCGGKWQDWCAVVHWWDEPGEQGFYLSSGLSADESPVAFSHWMPLPTDERDRFLASFGVPAELLKPRVGASQAAAEQLARTIGKYTCPSCGLDQTHAPISQDCGDFRIPVDSVKDCGGVASDD